MLNLDQCEQNFLLNMWNSKNRFDQIISKYQAESWTTKIILETKKNRDKLIKWAPCNFCIWLYFFSRRTRYQFFKYKCTQNLGIRSHEYKCGLNDGRTLKFEKIFQNLTVAQVTWLAASDWFSGRSSWLMWSCTPNCSHCFVFHVLELFDKLRKIYYMIAPFYVTWYHTMFHE